MFQVRGKSSDPINPDNFVQYPTGCTLACHFAPLKSACIDPPVTAPGAPPANPPTTTTSYTQQYNTNNACMGYAYSRVSQSALSTLINKASSTKYPKQVPGLPVQMLSGLPASLNTDPSFGLAAATSCPTPGTDGCIQLRLDAVGYAVTQLFITANASEKVTNQFRIGLYPFIQYLYSYFPLTSSINGSTSNSSTINYAAANLAMLLDTNTNANLGSGGTHIDTALNSVNSLIAKVGDGRVARRRISFSRQIRPQTSPPPSTPCLLKRSSRPTSRIEPGGPHPRAHVAARYANEGPADAGPVSHP